MSDLVLDEFRNHYQMENVFLLPARGLAAAVALSYVKDQGWKTAALSTTSPGQMLDNLLRLKIKPRWCDASMQDFGIDPASLEETTCDFVYAYHAYGLASSYISGLQGRFAIEDAMDSPFTPHCGVGDIVYTALPGSNVSILMSRHDDATRYFKSFIKTFALNVSTKDYCDLGDLLDNRHKLLLSRILSAHTLLRILPQNSIKTSMVLSNTYSSMPLILAKPNTALLDHASADSILKRIIPYDLDIFDGINQVENTATLLKFGLLISLEDLNAEKIGSVANRIRHYLESKFPEQYDAKK